MKCLSVNRNDAAVERGRPALLVPGDWLTWYFKISASIVSSRKSKLRYLRYTKQLLCATMPPVPLGIRLLDT